MATRSSDYASRDILQISWRRGKGRPSELPLTDSTTGNLLSLHLAPIAKIYCDGGGSSLEILDVFSDVRGKIPSTSQSPKSQSGSMGKGTLVMEKLIVTECVRQITRLRELWLGRMRQLAYLKPRVDWAARLGDSQKLSTQDTCSPARLNELKRWRDIPPLRVCNSWVISSWVLNFTRISAVRCDHLMKVFFIFLTKC